MNCEYCGSRVFETDRVCDRCGAPNKNHFEKKQETYGEYFREVERNSPMMPTSASTICVSSWVTDSDLRRWIS